MSPARPWQRVSAGAVLSGVAVVASAYADDAAPPAADDTRYGTLTVLIENDRIVNTDRHYTHGTYVSWVSPHDVVPDWVHEVLDSLPHIDRGGTRRIGLGGGQMMFTPDDIAEEALIREDRPYAGWLFGAVSLHDTTPSRRDGIELALGIVGPGSGAEQTQILVHETIGATHPRGWDNQLHNEPGVALTYERQWRRRHDFDVGGITIDAIPVVGATVGNVWTFPTVGLTGRFGQNIPEDFGPPRLRPSIPGSAAFTPTDDWGWYLFAGASARYVVRDIFLDGNSFRDSHHVEKIRWVGDFQAGIALVFRTVRLSYTQVFRTHEFEGQPDGDHFGAFAVSFRY